jgi:hypothetical protein
MVQRSAFLAQAYGRIVHGSRAYLAFIHTYETEQQIMLLGFQPPILL